MDYHSAVIIDVIIVGDIGEGQMLRDGSQV